MMKKAFFPLLLTAFGLLGWFNFQTATDWPEYLGGPERNHYSALDNITTQNVAQLQKTWEYHTRDSSGQMQCNPIIINGILYGTSSSIKVFALNAATGKEIWRYEAAGEAAWYNTNRGLTYWTDGKEERLLFSAGPWLYALDAKTGILISSFGKDGRISLKEGLGAAAAEKFVVASTPGVIFENLYVTGTRVSEGSDAAPGHIRAFDVRSGTLVWVFHTIPQPGEEGYSTWPKEAYKSVGGANSWAGMSIDRKRAIVYVPTGSAAFDFYGGNRKGQNLYANCLLALNARTGKRIWHYQTVHHDIWDRDLPSPPVLLTLKVNGKAVDAVAQTTKYGYIFVFDRVTGKPIFPIEEQPVPVSTLPGEHTWPTQPRPTKPAPYVRQSFKEEDLNPLSENRDELLTTFRSIQKGHLFTPPSKQGVLIFPGFDGGAEWGGAAASPDGMFYVNANEMPWVHQMTDLPKNEDLKALAPGERLYQTMCASCHGKEKKGDATGAFPSLVDLSKKRSKDYTVTIIKQGKGMMPGFPAINESDRKAIVAYLYGEEQKDAHSEGKISGNVVPYGFKGYNRFVDKNGFPAIKPPWGVLAAVDLNTGEYKWKIPLGEFKSLSDKGIPQTGTENYGGPVVTAGNLLFIGATKDEMFRAFDRRDGKLLWEYQLPAGGYATPSTYAVNGKQYVVIACGGAKMGTKKGDSYIAFALPN